MSLSRSTNFVVLDYRQIVIKLKLSVVVGHDPAARPFILTQQLQMICFYALQRVEKQPESVSVCNLFCFVWQLQSILLFCEFLMLTAAFEKVECCAESTVFFLCWRDRSNCYGRQ